MCHMESEFDTLVFSSKYLYIRAMQQIFDHKILARSPEVAAEWSEKLKMDCITLDGDLCSRKGALSGGYVDMQKSRLKAYEQQQKAKHNFQQATEEHRKVNAEAKEADLSFFCFQ